MLRLRISEGSTCLGATVGGVVPPGNVCPNITTSTHEHDLFGKKLLANVNKNHKLRLSWIMATGIFIKGKNLTGTRGA